MNIGILGGSFDPIHNGHLHMAKCAYESYALDQVWLIPAGHSPNKDEHGMTDAKDRFQMCKLAAQPYPWMTVSRLELDSAERSYTYRTMEKLSEQFPMHRFFFIMGGDSLDYFESWMKPEIIAQTAIILVMVRENFPKQQMEEKIAHIKKQFWADIRLLKCDRMDVSSTQVRKLLRAKSQADGYRSPKGAEMFLDAAVMSYIQANNLYR